MTSLGLSITQQPCPRHPPHPSTSLASSRATLSPGGDRDPAGTLDTVPLGSAIPRRVQFFLHSEEANEDRS